MEFRNVPWGTQARIRSRIHLNLSPPPPDLSLVLLPMRIASEAD